MNTNIWHDISKEPQNGSHILIQYDYQGEKEYKSFHIGYDEYTNWNKLVKIHGIFRWAYISDSFPKGGEPYVDPTKEYPTLNQVWHNINEEPQKYPILCQDELGNTWVQYDLKDYTDGWKEFSEVELIVRWAYVENLLPKKI